MEGCVHAGKTKHRDPADRRGEFTDTRGRKRGHGQRPDGPQRERRAPLGQAAAGDGPAGLDRLPAGRVRGGRGPGRSGRGCVSAAAARGQAAGIGNNMVPGGAPPASVSI